MIPGGFHDVSRVTRLIATPDAGSGRGDEMKQVRPLILVITWAAAVIVLAACGSIGGNPGAAQPVPRSTTRSSVSLTAWASVMLGTIVVDDRGRTLYRYDRDSTNPPASHCTGVCAQMWPPVLAGSGTVQLQGISRPAVGTVTRPDGTEQLTLGGSPLYEFTGDTGQGDIRGQAFDGTWWAIAPAGARITRRTMTPTTTDDHGGGTGGGPGGY
jgi:predicted lipoprotein with Yx(FWY)xxD motif